MTPVASFERQPHAVLDLASRDRKAMKIERLLDLAVRPRPLRMLEVGAGAGGIAHYFATHPCLRCEVTAVDVVDSRQVRDGYTFRLMQGAELPFAAASFDVFISNHVIEHVGGARAQHRHLAEIHRVMKPGGGYRAVPNRWMLTEPHYRLKFLSWWPHAWRTPYLRLMRKGTFYDCEPLRMKQLEHMLADAGFRYRNICSMLGVRRSRFSERAHPAHGCCPKYPMRFSRRCGESILTMIYRIEPALA